MKRLNITHGKAYFDDGIGNELEVVVDHRRLADFFNDSEESKANATLYADAHNTYHATGMLPSEMAERIKALEDGLRSCVNNCAEGHPTSSSAKALSKARALLNPLRDVDVLNPERDNLSTRIAAKLNTTEQ